MPLAAVSTNWFVAHLTDQDRSSLESHVHTIPVTADQVLQRCGDAFEYVILPHSAVVVIGVPGAVGGLTEAAILGREGILGGLAAAGAAPALHNAYVRVGGEVSRIPNGEFRKALDRSPAMRELAARCEAYITAQLQQSACCNALHSVEARLCRWLLQMDDRSRGHLPFTQDQIAKSLGVRRTTITSVASKFQKTGGLLWKRGSVQITNRQPLEQHVCECYGNLKNVANLLVSEPKPQRAAMRDRDAGGQLAAQLPG